MINQNSYLLVKNYFMNLQEQSRFINTFIGYSEREWNTKKTKVGGIQDPVLALFRYELGFESPEVKALAVRKIGFAIMLKVKKADDFEGQTAAIDTAEQLALKILSRINYDSNTHGHLLWNSFMKDSVQINPVELSANEFGVEVFFNLKNPQSLRVNVSDWDDIATIC